MPVPPAWAPCCAPSWTTTTDLRSRVERSVLSGWGELLSPPSRAECPTPNAQRPTDMTRSDLVEALAGKFQPAHPPRCGVRRQGDPRRDGEALVKGPPDRDPRLWQLFGEPSFAPHRTQPAFGRERDDSEKRVPHFKPGKALREEVDKKTAEILGREPKKSADRYNRPPHRDDVRYLMWLLNAAHFFCPFRLRAEQPGARHAAPVLRRPMAGTAGAGAAVCVGDRGGPGGCS